ncbi:MAG: radical SAM protein [Bacteroidales bacterium]|nr:radical SAM protein [Bacteroidales bacterium]
MTANNQFPNRKRIFLEVALEERCNLECGFCFQYKSNNRLEHYRIKPFFKKLQDSFITDVSFCGGEPLLGLNGLFKALKEAKKNKLNTTLITNGQLLNKTTVRKLAPLLNQVQLPLDGVNEQIVQEMRGGKNLFKKTLDNISLFNKERGFEAKIYFEVLGYIII